MKKAVNFITINTDASFNRKNGVCGFAFYIICDFFKITKGGAFKGRASSAMEAELWAMANALHTLEAQADLPEVKKAIIINSDCLWAFRQISLKSKNEAGRKVAQILKRLRKKTANRWGIRPAFEFRHVKAHNGTPDARSWVNDWCDKEAGKWSRIASKKFDEILNKQNEK
jgi:ribonuclease HI